MKIKVIGDTREQLHEEARNVTPETRLEIAEWLRTRPACIQEIAKQVDHCKIQRIKPGAPYRTTAPGTVGVVVGFAEMEHGEPKAIFVAHELHYDEQQHSLAEIEKIESLPGTLRVNVDVWWLEEDPSPTIEASDA